MNDLINLQIMMFLMIFAGLIVKRIGLVNEEGKKNITDLVLYLILPANIIKSFTEELGEGAFKSFLSILIISILIQVGCVILGKIFFRKADEGKRKCLQYGLICSNAGFLGNPIAEGVFGSMGLTLASVYLIPQRIMMWSSGLAVFSGQTDKRAMFKKVASHPCILACAIGLFLMVTGLRLPEFLDRSVDALASCNTALSMMVVGMILAEADIRTLFDRQVLSYSFVRLILIPLLVFLPCLALKVDSTVTGVSVLLAAMPAGATTSILASKYQQDSVFATKMVVCSTLLSLFSTAVWSFILI